MNPIRSLLLGIALVLPALADSPKGYYRFPAIHGDTIIFTAEGDLWRVSAKGGVAQRLTAHPGLEEFAAISPDGKSVAFTTSMTVSESRTMLKAVAGWTRSYFLGRRGPPGGSE